MCGWLSISYLDVLGQVIQIWLEVNECRSIAFGRNQLEVGILRPEQANIKLLTQSSIKGEGLIIALKMLLLT